MIAEIGIPLLLITFIYVIYLFTKSYPTKTIQNKFYVSYNKAGSRGIPGMSKQKSKKVKIVKR